MRKFIHYTLLFSCILALPLFFGLKFFSRYSFSSKDILVSVDFSKTDELNPCSFVFLLHPETDLNSCEQNLLSIIQQDYQNYRVILVTTKKKTLVTEQLTKFAARHNKEHLLSFYCAQKDESPLAAYKNAIASCVNHEIIIEMSMGDWLANEHVLSLLNKVYRSSKKIWLTYGEHLEYPSYKKGRLSSKQQQKQDKTLPWVDSSFKTYYAELFKQIYINQDNSHKNPLFSQNKARLILPIANQSKQHIHFIEEVLFVHKIDGSINPASSD